MEFVTLNILFTIFFGEVVCDFVTGILAAAKTGRLKSRTCSNGMLRSLGECIVLGIFIFVDFFIPQLEPILITFMLGFIFKEAMSIGENLTVLDVWIPDSLKKLFEVGKDKVSNMDINDLNKK